MIHLTKFWSLLFDESNLISVNSNVNVNKNKHVNVSQLISEWNVNLNNFCNDLLNGIDINGNSHSNINRDRTSWPPYPNLNRNMYEFIHEKKLLPDMNWNSKETLNDIQCYFDFLKLPEMDYTMSMNLFQQESLNFYMESSNKYLSKFIKNGKNVLLQCIENMKNTENIENTENSTQEQKRNRNRNRNSKKKNKDFSKKEEVSLSQFSKYMTSHIFRSMSNFLQHFEKIVSKNGILKENKFDFFLKVLIKEIICHGYSYLQNYISDKMIEKYYFSLIKPIERKPINYSINSFNNHNNNRSSSSQRRKSASKNRDRHSKVNYNKNSNTSARNASDTDSREQNNNFETDRSNLTDRFCDILNDLGDSWGYDDDQMRSNMSNQMLN